MRKINELGIKVEHIQEIDMELRNGWYVIIVRYSDVRNDDYGDVVIEQSINFNDTFAYYKELNEQLIEYKNK